jgi:hypothetical protein
MEGDPFGYYNSRDIRECMEINSVRIRVRIRVRVRVRGKINPVFGEISLLGIKNLCFFLYGL